MLLALLLSAINAATVTLCGGTFSVLDCSITPTNPVPGDNVTLHMQYAVPSLITDGTSQLTFTYNFLPLTPVVEPLCSNVPCPLEPGTYFNDTVFSWPDVSGTFTSVMKWTDPSSKLLLCIKISGSSNNLLQISDRAFGAWKTRRAH
jgi:hypothetical protein